MPTIRDGGTFFYSPGKCNWAEVAQVYLGFIEVQWDLPRWLLGWLGYKCKMRKRVCINAVGSKRLFCKATPVIAAYRVVSLPLHGLLAGLLASILCQVTQEKRTENSMFGSGVSVIVLGVEAFPRQSLVNWQHTTFLTWKLVIAAITTIV